MKITANPATILSTLVEANTKRFERYKSAADQMKEIDGKLFFMNYAVQSQEFITNLKKWLQAYGSSYTDQDRGIFIKSWKGLRQVLLLSGRKFLLGYCEFIELQSLKVYKQALTENVLPEAIVSDIKKQLSELEEAHLTMKSLRADSSQRMQVA